MRFVQQSIWYLLGRWWHWVHRSNCRSPPPTSLLWWLWVLRWQTEHGVAKALCSVSLVCYLSLVVGSSRLVWRSCCASSSASPYSLDRLWQWSLPSRWPSSCLFEAICTMETATRPVRLTNCLIALFVVAIKQNVGHCFDNMWH